MLQGHIDMVCEKNNDVQHDFHKDPLKLMKKGDWLKVSALLQYPCSDLSPTAVHCCNASHRQHKTCDDAIPGFLACGKTLRAQWTLRQQQSMLSHMHAY